MCELYTHLADCIRTLLDFDTDSLMVLPKLLADTEILFKDAPGL